MNVARSGAGAHAFPFGVAALFYAAFVVYGSLLPFDFRWVDAARAWQTLEQIPMLSLGMVDRADWVANLLLYIPLSVLVAAWAQRALGGSWIAPISAAAVLCGTVAIAVEFAQVYFPPRTVSLNDLLAEFIGIAVGCVLWVGAGERLNVLWSALSSRRISRARAALFLYVLAYLAASFFPYDFVVSLPELRQKIAQGGDGLFYSTRDCTSLLRCVLLLAAEVVSVLPIGFLMVFANGSRRRKLAPLLLGLGFGVFIEFVQLFVISGAGRGISVLTRGVGVLAGAYVAEYWTSGLLQTARPWARAIVLALAPLYIVGAAAAQGLHRASAAGLKDIGWRLGEVRWLPFYYHYFTTEANAFRSATQTVLLYAPVGILVWLWRLRDAGFSRTGGGATIWIAAALVCCFEALKLVTPGKRPDPTNVIIAVAAAALGYAACRFMVSLIAEDTRHCSGVTPTPTPTRVPQAAQAAVSTRASTSLEPVAIAATGGQGATRQRRSQNADVHVSPMRVRTAPMWHRVIGFLLIVAAVVFWWQQPVARVPLFVLGAGLGWLVWRHPAAWLVAVPTLVPVLDLAPWSGRFFFDETDLMLLVALGARLLAPVPATEAPRGILTKPQAVLWTTYVLACAISVAIGLWPLAPLDLNAFALYYSPYNALRVAKGLAWFLALALLLRRDRPTIEVLVHRFSVGMTLGLGATAAVVIWERWLFSGAFNFSLDYRVTGPMSSMHVGGAYLDSYLVMAAPITLLLALRGPGIVLRVMSVGAVVGAGYAAAVTFSRATIVAFAVALGVALLGYGIAILRAREHRRALKLGIAVAAVGAAAMVALPVVKGQFFQDRLGKVAEDVEVRKQHWREALGMLDRNWTAKLLGMGVGSYPSVHFWRSAGGQKPAAYGFVTEAGNSFLRLGSGDSLYLDQIVRFGRGEEYTLSFRARTGSERASLTVPICQKWLLTSFNCAWPKLELSSTPSGEWVTFEQKLRSETLGAGPWWKRRPVKLSLYNGSPGAVVDVDDVRLVGMDGTDLVRNGTFSAGSSRWFFTTDSHLPWHIKNLWVHLRFEQGWIGLVAFTALLVLATVALARKATKGDMEAPGLLGALAGATLLGAVDTTLDAPRLALLLYLLIFLGGMAKTR